MSHSMYYSAAFLLLSFSFFFLKHYYSKSCLMLKQLYSLCIVFYLVYFTHIYLSNSTIDGHLGCFIYFLITNNEHHVQIPGSKAYS